jgi:hypothetical protein
MIIRTEMERRAGQRARTDLPATSYHDGRARSCHALDLSTDGALLRHGEACPPPLVQRLALHLGAPVGTIPVLARTVWSSGPLSGVRFVGLGDVDRLELAERLDHQPGSHW